MRLESECRLVLVIEVRMEGLLLRRVGVGPVLSAPFVHGTSVQPPMPGSGSNMDFHECNDIADKPVDAIDVEFSI